MKKKILIVDDSPIILRTLSLKLAESGYDVVTAGEGGEAIRIIRYGRPDLILLDINFPPDVAHGGGVPWDGFLVMGWLHRIDEARGVPVIVISGEQGGSYEDRARAAGAVGFFQKPIECDRLLALISQVLGSEPLTRVA